MDTNIDIARLEIKEQALITRLQSFAKVAVCFSGGVDSSFLLIKAVEVLGKENVLAITGFSPVVSASDASCVKQIITKYAISFITIDKNEMEDTNFLRNDEKRCYYCKRLFFEQVTKVAKENGFINVLDGTNVDDEGKYRPGLKALEEFFIASPLKDARLRKAEIRYLAKKIGLANHDDVSESCYATRIPYHEAITYERLEKISRAEIFLHEKGFMCVRARYHDDLVKIEVEPKDIPRITEKNMALEINNYMKSIGFMWTSVDIIGYRSGSMDENK